MTAARRWPVTHRQVAAGLAGLTLLLTAADIFLTELTGNGAGSTDGGTFALSLMFLATGFLVARRQSGNPVGWLLMCTGLMAAFTTFTGLYVTLTYGVHPHALPLGRAVILAQNATWPVSIFTGMAAVLLFPDGQLTRRWRRALWAYVVVGFLVMVSQAIPGAALASTPDVHAAIVSGHPAPGMSAAVLFLASGLPVLAVVPFWLAWVVRQVTRFRRARGDARQQYKWFTAGAVVSVLGIMIFTWAESNSAVSGIRSLLNVTATYATAVAFPLSMGVAILRYRLYDIDRLISRTLAYAIVTGLLAGLYAGLVLLASQVLPVTASTPATVAVATLIAAALFSPLRRRVQRLVDRRFNRARYDAERTIAAFATRLQDATNLDGARADLLGAVTQALQPAHASVWVKTAQSR
jgi:hypothetical protein